MSLEPFASHKPGRVWHEPFIKTIRGLWKPIWLLIQVREIHKVLEEVLGGAYFSLTTGFLHGAGLGKAGFAALLFHRPSAFPHDTELSITIGMGLPPPSYLITGFFRTLFFLLPPKSSLAPLGDFPPADLPLLILTQALSRPRQRR